MARLLAWGIIWFDNLASRNQGHDRVFVRNHFNIPRDFKGGCEFWIVNQGDHHWSIWGINQGIYYSRRDCIQKGLYNGDFG